MTEVFSLSSWAFVLAIVAVGLMISLAVVANGWFHYRMQLQLCAENRRLTERILTFSQSDLAAKSAAASLEARDNVPNQNLDLAQRQWAELQLRENIG